MLLILLLRTQSYRCTDNIKSLSCPNIAKLNLEIAYWLFKKATTFFHLLQYFITEVTPVCLSIIVVRLS